MVLKPSLDFCNTWKRTQFGSSDQRRQSNSVSPISHQTKHKTIFMLFSIGEELLVHHDGSVKFSNHWWKLEQKRGGHLFCSTNRSKQPPPPLFLLRSNERGSGDESLEITCGAQCFTQNVFGSIERKETDDFCLWWAQMEEGAKDVLKKRREIKKLLINLQNLVVLMFGV